MKYLIKILIVFSISLNASTAQNYITYPLNIGDIWQYKVLEVNEYFYVEVIGDTTFSSNGYTYKILVNNYGVRGFRRIYNDKVYFYNKILQQDQIKYNFTLQPGDTVAVFPCENDTTIITLIDVRYQTIFGLERKQWLFLYDTVPYLDDEVVYTITDSIGLTSVDNIFLHQVLLAANINGNTYGTFVSVNGDHIVPKAVHLNQNYPNPFNPSTKISWQLPVGSWQTLKVFDVLGNEVVILVDEYKPAGIYEVEWSATGLPSGIYFYRLQAGDFIEMKKMILLR